MSLLSSLAEARREVADRSGSCPDLATDVALARLDYWICPSLSQRLRSRPNEVRWRRCNSGGLTYAFARTFYSFVESLTLSWSLMLCISNQEILSSHSIRVFALKCLYDEREVGDRYKVECIKVKTGHAGYTTSHHASTISLDSSRRTFRLPKDKYSRHDLNHNPVQSFNNDRPHRPSS